MQIYLVETENKKYSAHVSFPHRVTNDVVIKYMRECHNKGVVVNMSYRATGDNRPFPFIVLSREL